MSLLPKDYVQINQALFSITHSYETRMEKEEEPERNGLAITDCSVLMVVGQLQPLNSRQLAQRMDINPGTISLYVQRLVEKGLIVRQQDQGDRRNWWLTLTEGGQKAYEAILRNTIRYTQEFLAPLNRAEQEALHEMLLKVAHHLGFQWE